MATGKETTAMQELIEKLKLERLSNPIDFDANIGLTVAIGFATELLKKEKQQLLDVADKAFEAGFEYGIDLEKSTYWAENPTEPNKQQYLNSLNQ